MSTWKDCTLGVLPRSTLEKMGRLDDEFVIPKEGRILLPDDIAIAEADGYPLIVAASFKVSDIVAAHSSTEDVVSSILSMFRDLGVQPKYITMRFLMYSSEKLVKKFIKEAKKQGVVLTRMRDPLVEFLVANKIPYWERSYITLQVQQPEQPILRLTGP